MVDLHGKDKGNISLPKKLQSYDDEDKKNLPTIINTQRTFYSIKIADIENRINRLKTNLYFVNVFYYHVVRYKDKNLKFVKKEIRNRPRN